MTLNQTEVVGPMEHDVIISIRGKQSFPQSRPEIIELVTEGKLEDLGDDLFNMVVEKYGDRFGYVPSN